VKTKENVTVTTAIAQFFNMVSDKMGRLVSTGVNLIHREVYLFVNKL